MTRAKFNAFEYLPDSAYNRITDLRVNDPDLPQREARRRVRRDTLTDDGRLCS